MIRDRRTPRPLFDRSIAAHRSLHALFRGALPERTRLSLFRTKNDGPPVG